MTFDTRADVAARGVRRALEVVEVSKMSDLPTLERFDRYRERRARNRRIAAVVVGVTIPIALLVGAVRLLSSQRAPGPAAPTPMTLTSTARTDAFVPMLTYTLPAGWEETEDSARAFFLKPTAGRLPVYTGIYVFRDLVAADPAGDANTGKTGAAPVGTTGRAITHALARHPDVTTATPRPVSVGGLTGYQLDIGSKRARLNCTGRANVLCVTLLTGGPTDYRDWVIMKGERMRVSVLDLPSGGTVTVVIETGDGTRFDDLLREAAPIVESFDLSNT